MVHEDYRQMLSAHALSALDAEEAPALEAHLESCPECRLLLDQWQEISAVLALDAPTLQPSSDLRARILEAVRTAPSVVNPAGDRDVAAKVIPLPIKARTRWGLSQGWGAIAAVIVFAVLATSLAALWNQNNVARQELAYLAIQVKNAQLQLARQREAIEIVTKPGTRTAELAGTELAPEAQATIAYDRTGRAVLLADGLPPAGEGKSYQLWFIVGGQPIPGKVFRPDETGNGAFEDQLPAVARGSAIFAVTLEPEGGVKVPTGPIYLSSGS